MLKLVLTAVSVAIIAGTGYVSATTENDASEKMQAKMYRELIEACHSGEDIYLDDKILKCQKSIDI